MTNNQINGNILIADLTAKEIQLVELCRRIGFGEIINPETGFSASAEKFAYEVRLPELRTIKTARVEKVTRIAIHEGLPRQIEVSGDEYGTKYLKKIKVD